VSKNTGCFNHQSQCHFLVADNNRATLHQWTHIHFFARPARLALTILIKEKVFNIIS